MHSPHIHNLTPYFPSHVFPIYTFEPCSHRPVPNWSDWSVRKADRSKKINFYGTGLRESIFIGPIWEKVIFMGTGPRKGHFYGDQSLEKVIFIVNSPRKGHFLGTGPRKGHFYGDQSQKRSNNYWPEKNNYFYGPVLFLWDRSWGTWFICQVNCVELHCTICSTNWNSWSGIIIGSAPHTNIGCC